MTLRYKRCPQWFGLAWRGVLPAGLIVILLCLISAAPAAAESPNRPRRVLIIPSHSFSLQRSQLFLQGVFAEFSEKAPFKVTFLYENLELYARPSDRAYHDKMAASLKIKYAREKPDLILVTYKPAMQFMERYGEEIFGNVPVVYAGVGIEGYAKASLPAHYTVIAPTFDMKKSFGVVFKINPRLRNIYIIAGSSPIEQGYIQTTMKGMEPFKGRINCIPLTHLTFSELLTRVGEIRGDDSAILFHSLLIDAAGEVFMEHQTAGPVARAARVPVYTGLDTYMGSGITGGFLVSHEGMGRKAAEVGMNILAGKIRPGGSPLTEPIGGFRFDWRQLKRFGISEDRLPEGSKIEFKQFSVWENYKMEILGGVCLIIAQALLIIALLVHRLKRREAEENYRNLFNNAGEAIFVIQEGRIVFLNPMTAKMIGYTAEEILSRPMIEFIHPDDRAAIADGNARQMKGEVLPTHQGFRVMPKDGHTLWVASNAVLITWKKKAALLNFLEDITDRKRAEEEKSKLEAHLLQSQKMQAIGTLAGGIAHDFNNILSVIIGYTELAKDKNQKENKEQYLQKILDGAQRAKNLVKQILTFSRQDDHTEKKPLDIKVLLKEAVKFLRSSIPTTVEINQHITDEECNIMADHTQMHQVIMNLCTNAAHAMKEAGGILKIELTTPELGKGDIPNYPDLQPGHYVKLTVSDTGYGIDPAIVQRVFEPFFTTKSVDEGTGLGLSVVYGIVKSHGGVINVYSEQGKGAAFHVYLPRIIQAEAMKVDIDKPVIGGTERILFVDDEPALVDIAKSTLSSLGYDIIGILSSLEALNIISAEPQRFDLVITDMTLPKMTGIDLSRKILQIRPDIPIILCSGIREPDTEEQAKSLGIKAYCMKPLTKTELARVIREILDENERPVS